MTEPATRRERRHATPTPRAPRSLVRRAVLPLLALALLLWTLTCLVGVASSGLGGPAATAVAALASASPLVTLLAVVVITLAARRQDWAAIGVAALAGLLPWVFVGPYASEDEAPPTTGGAALRVTLINAHEGQASATTSWRRPPATRSTCWSSPNSPACRPRPHHRRPGPGRHGPLGPPSGAGRRGERPTGGDGRVGPGELDQPGDVPGTQWPAMTGRVTAGAASFTLLAGHVATPLPGGGAHWADELSTLREAAAGPRAPSCCWPTSTRPPGTRTSAASPTPGCVTPPMLWAADPARAGRRGLRCRCSPWTTPWSAEGSGSNPWRPW